jgi:hypothetical protein
MLLVIGVSIGPGLMALTRRCRQVLVDVRIGDHASPKTCSVLLQIQLLQLHVVHGDEFE